MECAEREYAGILPNCLFHLTRVTFRHTQLSTSPRHLFIEFVIFLFCLSACLVRNNVVMARSGDKSTFLVGFTSDLNGSRCWKLIRRGVKKCPATRRLGGLSPKARSWRLWVMRIGYRLPGFGDLWLACWVTELWGWDNLWDSSITIPWVALSDGVYVLAYGQVKSRQLASCRMRRLVPTVRICMATWRCCLTLVCRRTVTTKPTFCSLTLGYLMKICGV